MERVLAWCRAEARYVLLVKALLLALLPVLCCTVYCAAQGHWIGDISPLTSPWNDELYYYKQVESILEYGYPLGYFGFNESRALALSFAAWSPVLVFPWVLWGLVFGWNLMSPIVCNIFLMSLCCFLYVWLTRPSWRQLGVLAFLFCLYTPLTRFMLSGMAEAICFSMVILFYSLAVSYQRRKRAGKLVALYLLSGTMALMRPYLVLFQLLPAYFWIRRGRGRIGRCMRILGSLAILGLAVGMYACIKHYMGAEYFAPLFFTDWFDAFFAQGPLEGILFTLEKLGTVGGEFIAFMKEGVRTVSTTGGIFVGYVGCLSVLAIQSAEGYVRRTRREKDGAEAPDILAIEVHLALSFLVMLPALLLMYKLIEGSRHLLTFIAAAVFVIPLARTKLSVMMELGVGAAFAYLYLYRATDPYDYQLPFAQEERQASLEEWAGAFSDLLVLDEESAPSYENVIIWAYSEEIEGTAIYTTWQLLYALPKGFGISCCMREYIMENIGSLKSHYLIGPIGGEMESLYQEAGYARLYCDGSMALYEIR